MVQHLRNEANFFTYCIRFIVTWGSLRLSDAPDEHFDYLSLFSGTQAEKSWKSEREKKNCENCVRAEKKILCHEIDPNPSKDIYSAKWIIKSISCLELQEIVYTSKL
jgi:hypothetical protein